MPPRIRSPNFSSATVSCPVVRPQSIAQPARRSRQFSQTSCQQVTARRRRFYEWLNGPGSQLKEPLPSSTNYLGAYDKYGNLVRANPGYMRKSQDEAAAKEAESTEGESEETKTAEAADGQENVDELEMAVRRDEETKKKQVEEDGQKLPPETAEDLRPFPLNKYFRSQPVLSEDLREAIYQRVQRDGTTVSLASVEFGVSNERVGAVVRLKQMEKEWVAQVRAMVFSFQSLLHDELQKIRLVFKTTHMVTKLYYARSDIPIYYTKARNSFREVDADDLNRARNSRSPTPKPFSTCSLQLPTLTRRSLKTVASAQ